MKRKIGSADRAPKPSPRQFDHARRDVNPNAARHFRSKGQEMMAIAATEVEDDIFGRRLGQVSHQRQPVFEQLLRITVRLRKSRCGTLIKVGSDVRGVVCGSGRDAATS
jgi:hypothetical protein